jgi:hypothetical protein
LFYAVFKKGREDKVFKGFKAVFEHLIFHNFKPLFLFFGDKLSYYYLALVASHTAAFVTIFSNHFLLANSQLTIHY